MALHDYVIETLGSKSTLRVLRTLLRYRGKIFTIRELGRTAGLSHPEAAKVVKELEKRGVVKLQPIGNAFQVSLNEDSYILKSVVEPVFEAEKNTLNSIISTIKPFFTDKRIYSTVIFGSVAKGLEKITSDIDLLVITQDKDFAIERISRASSALISKFGFALSPLILSKGHFIREAETQLEKSILESYVTVSGADLLEVLTKNGKSSR